MLHNIEKGFQYIDLHVNRVLAATMGVLTFLCMLLITCSIGGRYLLGMPVPSSVELSEAILVLVIFLPFAYIDIQGGHLRITALYSRFSTRWQKICDIFSKVVSVIFFSLMTWQTLKYAIHSWVSNEVSWGMIPIPLWIPKFAIFFGCLIFSIHLLGSLVLKAKNVIGGTA